MSAAVPTTSSNYFQPPEEVSLLFYLLAFSRSRVFCCCCLCFYNSCSFILLGLRLAYLVLTVETWPASPLPADNYNCVIFFSLAPTFYMSLLVYPLHFLFFFLLPDTPQFEKCTPYMYTYVHIHI